VSELPGLTNHNTVLFIVTAVRTSNPILKAFNFYVEDEVLTEVVAK
jgi:hypothetical protein